MGMRQNNGQARAALNHHRLHWVFTGTQPAHHRHRHVTGQQCLVDITERPPQGLERGGLAKRICDYQSKMADDRIEIINQNGNIVMKRRPTKTRLLPTNYDPYLRFIAAYATQAVIDYMWPPKNLEYTYRQSAIDFVNSEDGQSIIGHFNIPQSKITQTVGVSKC